MSDRLEPTVPMVPVRSYEEGIEAGRLNGFLEAAKYAIDHDQPLLMFPTMLQVLYPIIHQRQQAITPHPRSSAYRTWFKWEWHA